MKKFVLLLIFILNISIFAVESVALVSDIHFHDINIQFENNEFKGILSEDGKRRATIRTMESQLNSTRLFNENYFAFISTLDSIAEKGIKYVILSGDQTDDGQSAHLKGLEKILTSYSKKYGMNFFMTFGNHDPNTPFDRPQGIEDWLGNNGDNQGIYSSELKDKIVNKSTNPIIYTPEATQLGYEKLLKAWGKYGFMPKKSDVYWETPFSTYTQDTYTYKKAMKEAQYKKRLYTISPNSSENATGFEVFDGSYLVEPEKGLWILSIDSNVYIPKDKTNSIMNSSDNFGGSGNNGYGKILTHKKHLANWIKKVTTESEKQGKKLIVFSHFPLNDFFEGADDDIQKLFGKGKMQSSRNPSNETSHDFSKLGIKLHFAGHMHIQDSNKAQWDDGKFLYNIQIPSLAAYVPAYKILTFNSEKEVEIRTIEINEVKDFNKLFEFYEKEYSFLKENHPERLWNHDILKSRNYREFADWHLKELVRLRFLKKEWKKEVRDVLEQTDAEQLALFATNGSSKEKRIKKELQNIGLTIDDLKKVNGIEIATDFHRLLNGDLLSYNEISEKNLKIYDYLNKKFSDDKEDEMYNNFKLLFRIMEKQNKVIPYKDFRINLETGEFSNL